jgi:transglutaminase-like putative cysteine protease
MNWLMKHLTSATHAWADVYVPGPGWIAYDPTNGTIDSGDLIRVAVTRDISQAIPVAGSFLGASDSYLGMAVDVTVTSESGEGSKMPRFKGRT